MTLALRREDNYVTAMMHDLYITDIGNLLIYQPNRYSIYDPFTFPIPNLFSSKNMLETMMSTLSDHSYDMDLFSLIHRWLLKIVDKRNQQNGIWSEHILLFDNV